MLFFSFCHFLLLSVHFKVLLSLPTNTKIENSTSSSSLLPIPSSHKSTKDEYRRNPSHHYNLNTNKERKQYLSLHDMNDMSAEKIFNNLNLQDLRNLSLVSKKTRDLLRHVGYVKDAFLGSKKQPISDPKELFCLSYLEKEQLKADHKLLGNYENRKKSLLNRLKGLYVTFEVYQQCQLAPELLPNLRLLYIQPSTLHRNPLDTDHPNETGMNKENPPLTFDEIFNSILSSPAPHENTVGTSIDRNHQEANHHGLLKVFRQRFMSFPLLEYFSFIDSNKNSILNYALENEWMDLSRSLIFEYKTEIHYEDRLKRSSLWLSTSQNNVDYVRELLAQGANPNVIDTQTQKSPLIIALTFDYKDIATMLINDERTDLDFFNGSFTGYPPLVIACLYGRWDFFNIMLNAKHTSTNIQENAFMNRNMSMDNFSTEFDGNHNQRNEKFRANMNLAGFQGMNPLLCATDAEKTEYVEKLVKRGADVSAINSKGETALIVAVKNRSKDLIQILLENGADVNHQEVGVISQKKYTPLIHAAVLGYLDIAQELVKRGADIYRVDRTGNNALMYASAFGQLQILKYLLEDLNMDVRRVDHHGKNALMAAVISNQFISVHYLIRQDQTRYNSIRQSSNSNGSVESIPSENLLINSRTKDGKAMTSLMLASQLNLMKMTKLLIDHGADLTLRNARGQTAFDIAYQLEFYPLAATIHIEMSLAGKTIS